MLTVNGEKEYILDLNKSVGDTHILSTDSKNSLIFITYVSNRDAIYASVFKKKHILIKIIDFNKLKEDAVVIIQNLKRESIKVVIKPNIEKSRERNYVFKLGKHTVNNKSITLNVISKENGKTEPWHVSYDGKPISYIVSQTKTKITFTLSTILATEFTSNIQLKQDNSGKVINIKLKHKDNNSVELEKVD